MNFLVWPVDSLLRDICLYKFRVNLATFFWVKIKDVQSQRRSTQTFTFNSYHGQFEDPISQVRALKHNFLFPNDTVTAKHMDPEPIHLAKAATLITVSLIVCSIV